jgi:uncharacterized membrane protein YiaA
MSEETTIYEQHSIKITNLRAVFGEKTYSVANITSVEAKTIAPSMGLAFIIFVVGIVLFLVGVANFKENLSYIIWSIGCFVLFYFMNRSAKPTYTVSLTTASGEVKATESGDQQTIKQIVEALNTAIIQKG